MNIEQNAVLTEVRALAERRNWTPVVALVDDLLTGQAATIAVAAPGGADTSAFYRWIAQREPDSRVIALPLEGLAQDPLPAVKAEKLIAVFECGVLLGTSEANAIVRAFFCRPSGSYAIVLSSAERITSEEELDLIERGAWRLLVPDPKPSWNQQNLLEYGCYLWSDVEPSSFLHTRIQRDTIALASWLHQPLACAEDFKRMQVLCAIDLAEEYAYQREEPVQGEADLFAHQLTRAREALTTLRRRLTRRLDDDTRALERQLTTSLQSLEQDLLHGLGPYLQWRLPHAISEANADLLETLMVEYITAEADRWKEQAQHLLSTRGEEITSEINVLLHTIDWSLINTVVAKKDIGQTYPQALLKNQRLNSDLSMLAPNELEGVPPRPLESTTSFSANIRALLVGGLTGSGVLAATTIYLGFGPVQLVAAGAAAMLSGMLVKSRLEHGQVLKLAEMHGRSTIIAVMNQAIAYVQERIRQSLTPIRDHLSNELRVVEDLVNEALWEIRRSSDQANAAATDRQLLEDYRRKVATVELP